MRKSFNYLFKVPMHIIHITRDVHIYNNLDSSFDKSHGKYVVASIESIPSIVSRENIGLIEEPIYSYFPITISSDNIDLITYDSSKSKETLEDAIISYLDKDLNKDKDNILLYGIDVNDFSSKNYMSYYDPEVKCLLNNVNGIDVAKRSQNLNNYSIRNEQNGRRLLRIPKNK